MAARGAAFERTRFGAYELLAPLAVGGTAEIFLARWTSLGVERIVVVKQLLPEHEHDEEFGDMFLDEARLGAQLSHPNIVQTYEMGTVPSGNSVSGPQGPRRFIVMEYLAGLTLGQVVLQARARLPGGLPAELAAGMLAQAAMGLHHAHGVKLPDGTELRIVHRDVSPQNLIVTFQGEVKVVDFGIAHAAVREARTKTGMVKGKFAYMAPEQCTGNPVDRRTDVFALGVVLWECLTGQRLFKRKGTYETYRAILSGEIPAPSQVNPALDRALDGVALTALAREPERRFPTAQAFAHALEGWLRGRGQKADVARFIGSVFADEVRTHDERMQRILAGGAVDASGEAWDRDDESEPQRPPMRPPGLAGPDDATVLADAPVPARRRSSAPLLLGVAAVVLAVLALIAWLAR
jgi:serine/threonine protein kinase